MDDMEWEDDGGGDSGDDGGDDGGDWGDDGGDWGDDGGDGGDGGGWDDWSGDGGDGGDGGGWEDWSGWEDNGDSGNGGWEDWASWSGDNGGDGSGDWQSWVGDGSDVAGWEDWNGGWEDAPVDWGSFGEWTEPGDNNGEGVPWEGASPFDWGGDSGRDFGWNEALNTWSPDETQWAWDGENFQRVSAPSEDGGNWDRWYGEVPEGAFNVGQFENSGPDVSFGDWQEPTNWEGTSAGEPVPEFDLPEMADLLREMGVPTDQRFDVGEFTPGEEFNPESAIAFEGNGDVNPDDIIRNMSMGEGGDVELPAENDIPPEAPAEVTGEGEAVGEPVTQENMTPEQMDTLQTQMDFIPTNIPLADGTYTSGFQDPDGTMHIYNSDGTITLRYPDGSEENIDLRQGGPGGGMGVQAMKVPLFSGGEVDISPEQRESAIAAANSAVAEATLRQGALTPEEEDMVRQAAFDKAAATFAASPRTTTPTGPNAGFGITKLNTPDGVIYVTPDGRQTPPVSESVTTLVVDSNGQVVGHATMADAGEGALTLVSTTPGEDGTYAVIPWIPGRTAVWFDENNRPQRFSPFDNGTGTRSATGATGAAGGVPPLPRQNPVPPASRPSASGSAARRSSGGGGSGKANELAQARLDQEGAQFTEKMGLERDRFGREGEQFDIKTQLERDAREQERQKWLEEMGSSREKWLEQMGQEAERIGLQRLNVEGGLTGENEKLAELIRHNIEQERLANEQEGLTREQWEQRKYKPEAIGGGMYLQFNPTTNQWEVAGAGFSGRSRGGFLR